LSSPERQLLAANVRLGIALHRAEWPWRVWLLARLLPELVRTLVYVLIGLLVGGEPGMRFALVGCFVLIIASTTVGEVTDLPSIDVQTGTYRSVLLGRVSAPGQYAARALPLLALALAAALAYAVTVPFLAHGGDLVWPLIAHAWMLVPAAVGGAMLGLVVIAPAIGSSWEGLTYNAAIALVTVASGAIVTPPPALAALGQLLPFTHTVAALRRSLAGESSIDQVAWECAVAFGWAVLAWGAYRWQEARGRRRAVGAFVG